MNILYVGDGTVDVMMIVSTLTQLAPDHRVLFAADWPMAERCLRSTTVDLALLDFERSAALGLQVLRHLRSARPEIACVILAAPDDRRHGVTALQLGIDYYLVKHGDYLPGLAETLERVLEARQPGRRSGEAVPAVVYWHRDAQSGAAVLAALRGWLPGLQVEVLGDVDEYRARPAGAAECHLLLLDCDDAGLDPALLAQWLRARPRADIPVVVMSRPCTAEVVARALQAGASEYFLKDGGNLHRLPALLEHAQRRSRLAYQESALRRSVQRMNHLLASTPSILYAVEWLDGRVRPTWISDNFTPLLGYPLAAAFECDWWRESVHPLDRERVEEAFAQLWERGRLEMEYRFRHRNGSVLWVKDHARVLPQTRRGAIEVVGSWSDITRYKEGEERIERLTHYDALTGLPNRQLFETQLDSALQAARRSGACLAVMLIDIDRFRDINESLGHRSGDALLRAAGARLADLLALSGVLARYGGDEFVLLAQRVTGADEALQLAQEITAVLAQPVTLDDGIDIRIGGRVGVSLFPAHGGDGAELIQHADAALNHAKSEGRTLVQLYAAELTRRSRERLHTIIRLRRAVESERLQVVYQPKVDIRSNAIVGAEALARWWEPESGFVSPSCFIPIAEQSGLVNALSESVLLQACRDARAWQEAGLKPIVMAVNLSPRQLEDTQIPATIAAILREAGLDSRYLEFELTEGALMTESANAEALLRQIKAHGVRLSLDDFGTGYSSLAYLRRFPLDTIKIDKRFVHGVPDDKDDVAILRAVVQLAHALGFAVLAEGVETEAQLAFLRTLGCDLYQGYLYSKPVPFAEFSELLARSQQAAPR